MSLPTTTRQYSYPELGSYNNLLLEEVPVGPLKPNDVLVKTHAVSLQFRDLQFPAPIWPAKSLPSGEDVKEWKKGDRVSANFMLDKLHDEQTAEIAATALGGAVHGVLTQYRTFPAHSLVAIPEHLSYEEASTLPFALQFAVASGATVIATSSDDNKLKIARKLGAKHLVNYKKTPNWDEEVLKLTNGVGVDRVLEVAGNSTLERSISSVRINGSIDIIGSRGGRVNVPPVDIVVPSIYKGLKIRGIFIGSVAQFKNMNKLLSANPETTRPIVDKVFAFEDAKKAFAYLESQAHVGKVVIRV
ncbi:Alcohol dehydrogenase superfamily protein [Mycena venus]|uniref:Alcohol dehydrogenase superfamily protein n=1 Tax=Mycena venus TaxID=2733690 RepID=A0A8H6YA37_9AGAR|nr:Alcohol dehydrogenase superfamily protein [Mycena venus]